MDPEPYLAWAILGLILVIAELVTGTFYLVVLGVAAFGASAAAYFGYDFPIQSIVAGLVAAAGAYWVHVYRVNSATQQMKQIDAGQPALGRDRQLELLALRRRRRADPAWRRRA